MKTIHIIAIITISFIAGMFGGAFSERVFANPKGDEKIPEQIVARGFYLVDENNKPRAGMSFDEAGQPSFYVKDTSGRVRGYMALVPGGPMLALNDNRGNMSIGLSSYEDGKSIVVLMGKNEKPRLALDYKPGKGPALLLFDEENIGKAVMAVRNGMPNVT
ncbi:MAG: hypothetical protein KKC78_11255, partial [Proteobacteria bacterium]|nr:hypothetical protein [Pseudomonadota bacterium]